QALGYSRISNDAHDPAVHLCLMLPEQDLEGRQVSVSELHQQFRRLFHSLPIYAYGQVREKVTGKKVRSGGHCFLCVALAGAVRPLATAPVESRASWIKKRVA